ncbi:alpha/beta fold hydrolase [Vagococcus sp. WN89Y]|uniref:alpha/beta fold hydrolase n=1 Tax=Vagococcus sp. WN89Y TaxID=3457258 RepID=UPI003FCDC1F9
MIRYFKQCGVGLLIVLMFLAAGCAHQDARTHARELSKRAGFVESDLQTQSFLLRTLSKTGTSAKVLRVYIEGDGFAWVTRSQPSTDPTPHNPVGLLLAAADPSANVLYLARPCQYTGPPLPTECSVKWWTDERFSLPVIAAMDEALSQFTRRMPGVSLELVGYSGGATLAAQLAARRHDVVSLRTVAGNLDVAFVNQLHNVSAMPKATSAIDVAARLASLPQIHFSGTQDRVVPVSVAKRYQRVAGTRCTRVEQVAGMQHGSDWAARWPQLLAKVPGCDE